MSKPPYIAVPEHGTPKFRDAVDQAAWLACLGAAASCASGEHTPSYVLELADQFFAEFRARCER